MSVGWSHVVQQVIWPLIPGFTVPPALLLLYCRDTSSRSDLSAGKKKSSFRSAVFLGVKFSLDLLLALNALGIFQAVGRRKFLSFDLKRLPNGE